MFAEGISDSGSSAGCLRTSSRVEEIRLCIISDLYGPQLKLPLCRGVLIATIVFWDTLEP